ncbi:hypothetical protein [Enterococcus sp. LJL90]
MEKTIYIDDKPVRLKSTAATPLRYKAQFRKDYFAELLKLAKFGSSGSKNEEEEDEFDLMDISFSELDTLDFEVIYNFIWVLAKTADSTIPAPMEWLDNFDSMPIAEVFPEVAGLLEASIASKKKWIK